MALTEKYVSALAGGSGNGLSEGTAFTFTQMFNEITAGSGPGNRYNIKKNGTYTRSGYDNLDGKDGTSTNPIVCRGYNVTLGDGFLGRTNTNGALITTNMPLIQYTSSRLQVGRWYVMESLNIEANTGDPVLDVNEQSMVIGCRTFNPNTNSGPTMGVRLRNRSIAFESDFLHTGATGGGDVIDAGVDVKVDSCRIVTSSTACKGIKLEQIETIFGCFIKGNGGPAGISGESANRNGFFRNNTIVGFQDAFYFATTEAPLIIAGNMITGNSGYALNLVGTSCPILIGPNRLRDNTLGAINLGGSYTDCGRIYPSITTDTGGDETDYVDAAGSDYNLIAASPGKESNVWKYSDMGAFQRAAGTGGGGAAVFNPLAQTIIRPA